MFIIATVQTIHYVLCCVVLCVNSNLLLSSKTISARSKPPSGKPAFYFELCDIIHNLDVPILLIKTTTEFFPVFLNFFNYYLVR